MARNTNNALSYVRWDIQLKEVAWFSDYKVSLSLCKVSPSVYTVSLSVSESSAHNACRHHLSCCQLHRLCWHHLMWFTITKDLVAIVKSPSLGAGYCVNTWSSGGWSWTVFQSWGAWWCVFHSFADNSCMYGSMTDRWCVFNNYNMKLLVQVWPRS